MQPPAYPPAIDEVLCAALRGEKPAWPWTDGAAPAALLAHAALHGVAVLLYQQAVGSDWPIGVVQALRERAVQQAMWELRHQQLLKQTLAALHALGIDPVLIKGTALAYSLYPDPVLRSRGDTDLLIPADAKDPTDAALLSLGYQRLSAVAGESVSYQATYTQRTPEGGTHALDLHWKINNSELLSRLFTYGELWEAGVPLPELGPSARGPSMAHSMLVACMHRATHRTNPYYVDGKAHHDPDRLIWLADIHLMAQRLSAQEWHAVTSLAETKGLRSITLDALQLAQASWKTTLPEFVVSALAVTGAPERPGVYLAASRLRQQWIDLLALDSWKQRLRWAIETVFPSADYMRGKYVDAAVSWLPWLYLRRAMGGIAKAISSPHIS